MSNAPNWLIVTPAEDPTACCTTYVRWWKPSFWWELRRLFTDPAMRRFEDASSRHHGLNHRFDVLLSDHLNGDARHIVERIKCGQEDANG